MNESRIAAAGARRVADTEGAEDVGGGLEVVTLVI
jgi:hypothetical protein